MIEAHATARYVRTSAQKAGLVLDLIRGKQVTTALAALKFSGKGVARDVAKVLNSAIANAKQKDGFGGDVERLFVSACYANQGPSQKRIRPAPMGRAFRILHRTAHLTVAVTEKAETTATATTTPSAARRARVAKSRGEAVETPAKQAAPRARKAAAPKAGAGAKETAAKKPAAKKKTEKGE
jgi:large subunit ribosomal protein L22